jgi:PAS domain S-box-containing protein
MQAGHDPEDARLEALAAAVVDAAGAAGIGFFVTSSEGGEPRTLYANAAAQAISGYSTAELLGMPTLALGAPEAVQSLRARREQRARGETPPSSFESVLLRKDGVRVPVELSVSDVELDGQPLAVTFFVDITPRKRAQEALRNSEERFRRLIESLPEAVWIVDRQGVVYANPAAVQLFGYERLEDVMGVDPANVVHPEDAKLVRHRGHALLGHDERLPPHEYRVIRRDGREMVVEVSSIAVEYENRRAVLSFGRDVTERKQIEGQLLQAERLAALGLLAGGMAHAINNPLTYVLLNLEHLARKLPSLVDDSCYLSEALVRLKEAHHGAERVAGVIRQMRTLSRADEQVRAPVDVRRVLDAAVAMVGNEIRHRGRLVTEYGDVPPVYASTAPLEQVFLNLLVHAARSLPEAANGEVRILVKSDDAEHIVVEISHNGPAPEAGKYRLSEPFPLHESRESGMLGLSLCYGILTGLGGDMRVETRGEKTVFRVTLPAANRIESKTKPPPSSEPMPSVPRASRARVLVIDDDPGVGSALRLMLESEHDVTCCTSGREALQQLLRDSSYDIVFCDLMMPELTGMDLFQALKLNRPGAEQKIVFMTGGAFTQEAERFLAQVKRPHIEKPFNMQALSRLLRSAVRATGAR